MQTPKPGDMVNYVVKERIVFPAVITRVWSNECVNLRYFMDGDFAGILVPVTSVLYREAYIGEDEIPNSWHYRDEYYD